MTSTTSTTRTTTEIANELLGTWENALRKFQNNSPAREATAPLPTALDLYQMGCILHVASASPKFIHKNNLNQCFRTYLQALPDAYRTKIFQDLDQSFRNVLQRNAITEETNAEELQTQAIDAINRIYSSMTKSTILSAVLSSWDIDTLSILVENFQSTNNSSVLSLLEIYLMNTMEFEKLLPALHLLQDTLWDDLTKSIEKHNRRWKEQLVSNFLDIAGKNNDPAQTEYLTMMLANSHSEEAKIAKQSHTASLQKKQKTTAVAAASTKVLFDDRRRKGADDEIQRRIDQIRAVLPHLGEGFIEMALAQFQGNVETTIAHLIVDEDQWPETWKRLDYRNLPRSRDKQQLVATKLKQEEEDAKKITKAVIRETDRRQEELALLLERVAIVDEYNDDYDDQYDDMIGKGASNAVPDHFLYDDYDAIRAYNTTLKSVEAESAFWDENRNTNRPPRKVDGRSITADMPTIEQEEDDEQQQQQKGSQTKQYRGPDKMRGGRIPGRGRGREGRGQQQQQQQPKKNSNDQATTNTSEGKEPSTKNKPNLRAKSHKLDKRREQQKKAQAKRSDGGL